MSIFGRKLTEIPAKEDALPGRSQRMALPSGHFVNGAPLEPPFDADAKSSVSDSSGGSSTDASIELTMFGMGCFWGAERIFWRDVPTVSTVVGYAGGWTPNPTYEEVCTGRTGHNEVVLVAFEPSQVSFEQLLKVFWEHHDPTQGMRQGNDVGTQYRSGIYVFTAQQREIAEASLKAFDPIVRATGRRAITTEIVEAVTPGPGYAVPENVQPSPSLAVFYAAEPYHQQYLAKNPNGYCGIGPNGMSCPIGVAKTL